MSEAVSRTAQGRWSARRWRISPPVVAALAALLVTLSFWPGLVGFDATMQHRQVVSGIYYDWHPPIMARLWSVLPGARTSAAGMLVLQQGGYWLGIGLLAHGLRRAGRPRLGWAVIGIGAFPLFVCWEASVIKDAQMAAAMVAAFGLIACYRLHGRPVPALAWAGAGLLLGYATLVRGNAVFGTVPLLVMLVELDAVRRVMIGVVASAVVLVAAGPINHHLFGARPPGQQSAPFVFDLVGIDADGGTVPFFAEGERRALRAKACYTPVLWDPLFQPGRCGAETERLRALPILKLAGIWSSAVVHNPLPWARHRLLHLNRSFAWLVGPGTSVTPNPRNWVPPRTSPEARWRAEMPEPRLDAQRLVRLTDRLAVTPLGWPILWLVAAATLTVLAARATPRPARSLALALLVSALAMWTSFLLISIASPFRYHLWPVLATALAAPLTVAALAGRRVSRPVMLAGIGAVALVALAGGAARLVLPRQSEGYAGLIGGDPGGSPDETGAPFPGLPRPVSAGAR